MKKAGAMARKPVDVIVDDGSQSTLVDTEHVSYTAVLLSQGDHRFYTVAMPSDVLAETCMVDPREENPIDGFQRVLDKRRAQEIADYIDNWFGTIPGSIVLSAQPEAELEYIRKARTIRFRKTPRSFLIIDGQHRVYGFKLAEKPLRVPVVIYNKLTRPQECRLFMDINTKQRPVSAELILDIKRLAETDSDTEAVLREVFDSFNADAKSPLFGLLSPSDRKLGKLSRATFNQASKSIWPAFSESDAKSIYTVVSAFLHACASGLRDNGALDKITNPTLFKAIILMFPLAAQRVSDRFGNDYSVANFQKVLSPLFKNVRKSDFQTPGASHKELNETFKKAFNSGFTLGRTA
jgi:DGQHR domain-containing protein